MSARREFSKAVRLAAWDRCAGRCEGCGAKLFPGHFQFDHVIADGLGGEPTVENCRVLCSACHGEKTARVDVPAIAKAKRRQAAHIGACTPGRRPMPGGRASKWKRTMDGRLVRRDAE